MATVDLLLGALVGFLLGSTLGPLVRPWTAWLERLFRRAWRENPLLVHVEHNPSIMWAGAPPWVGASVFFAGTFPGDSPPGACTDWHQWATRRGGIDVGLTMLQVTIQAKVEAAVVIETPIVRSKSSELPSGVVGTCPVGGAAMVPRHFEIDLDSFGVPTVSFRSAGDGEFIPPPSFVLAAGEVERFQIWARASRGLHKWTLDLPLLVEGRRTTVSVADGHQPFATVGSDEASGIEFFWQDGQWRRSNLG